MEIHYHKHDLPDDVSFTGSVAVDTEAMGLQHQRDRLCVVQLSGGDGQCHVVQIFADQYAAPNLKALMADRSLIKIFHYARFDLGILQTYLGVMPQPVYCTKIASKLCRTYTDRHGLKDLCREILGLDISKAQQSSDWGADNLTPAQLEYAASDVLHLHKLKERLDAMLAREGRTDLVQGCFDFLPQRVMLDLAGWSEEDIFSH